MNPSEHILRTLARHIEGHAHVRLLGGAAMILGYGLHRSTEDVDLLLDDDEVQVLIDQASLGRALDAANAELEPQGLYLTHIWGPEQEILTPEWRGECRPVEHDFGSSNLTVSVLGPVDMVLSKLCRADEEDLEDIRHLIEVEGIDREKIADAMDRAIVPEVFSSVFPENGEKVLALFDE